MSTNLLAFAKTTTRRRSVVVPADSGERPVSPRTEQCDGPVERPTRNVHQICWAGGGDGVSSIRWKALNVGAATTVRRTIITAPERIVVRVSAPGSSRAAAGSAPVWTGWPLDSSVAEHPTHPRRTLPRRNCIPAGPHSNFGCWNAIPATTRGAKKRV